MATGTERDPQHNLLIGKLIEKTRTNKLRWQETAKDDAYLAAVRGLHTYEVQANDQGSVQVLTVHDEIGRLIIKIVRSGDPLLGELHELARRCALQVDEKIDRALQVLNEL